MCYGCRYCRTPDWDEIPNDLKFSNSDIIFCEFLDEFVEPDSLCPYFRKV